MNSQILKKQKLLFSGMLVALLALSFALFYTFQNRGGKENQQPNYRAKLELPSDKEQPQEILLGHIQNQNSVFEKRLDFLEKTLVETKKRGEETVLAKDRENSKLRSELEQLKKELREERDRPKSIDPPRETAQNDASENAFFKSPFTADPLPPSAPRALAFIHADTTKKMVNTVDRTIPSGTTVKALLVSSVDAVCSVMSANNPQPVKLRILDDGRLPKCVRAKLKGGLVIASVYGDLSSERVYMRPERLTQIKANGEFVETMISGFITGEDGKNGLRGTVVDKSEKIVGNAALSGLFSGASQYLQAMIRSKYCGYGGYYGCGDCGPCNKDGACYPYGLDVAGEGATNGACSGLDLLTRYYIQRAEQVRPVIQITAGRIVDITFSHSAELGDLYTREKVRNVREESRKG